MNFSDALRNICLERSTPFSFETVLSREDKLEFLRKARATGFFTEMIYVTTCDPAINVTRIKQRV